MDYSLAVHIDQSPSNISQLKWSCSRQRQAKVRTIYEKHTSPTRSASILISTYSLMVPFAIHSDTITNRCSAIVTPTSGSTFG